jgi:CheY-like chemotaxis protein
MGTSQCGGSSVCYPTLCGVGSAVADRRREDVLMAVILVVEDEMIIGQVARLTIEDMGHKVLAASDADEAITILRSCAELDALLTDIRLKTAALGGYTVAEQGRKLWPQLRVVYASGSPLTDQVKVPFVEGAHFLQKPYSQEQLATAIDRLLTTAETSEWSTPLPT